MFRKEIIVFLSLLVISIWGKFVPSYVDRKVAHISGRVVGGEDAIPHNYPWHVSLTWNTNDGQSWHNCGGSILNESWILTAAHCVFSLGNGYYDILAGKHDLRENEEGEQISRIRNVIIHEMYDSSIIGPHDIALVELETPVVFSSTVQPIQLPQQDAIPSGNARIVGWGSISNTSVPEFPDILQTAPLPILTFDTCMALLQGTSFEYSNICTGPIEGGAGTCNGDSGGGLFQDGPTVVGIVSWGWVPCASPNLPSAYARVSHYIDWIKQNTNIP